LKRPVHILHWSLFLLYSQTKRITMKSDIEKWKIELQSKDWEIVSVAAENLAKRGGDIGFDILINSLESEDVGLRNRVALALRKKKDNGAVDPLLKAILSPENRDYNGTMVYALQILNCQYKLVELFQILFYESYESKMMAYMILEEQIFEFSQADLFEIQKMWQDCLQQ